MMYDLVCIKRGKEQVVMTDNLLKVKARMKVLKDSQRGIKQTYEIRPSQSEEKYKKKHKFRSH